MDCGAKPYLGEKGGQEGMYLLSSYQVADLS
jgi:hypothetical protein